jgi:hypothetical protein
VPSSESEQPLLRSSRSVTSLRDAQSASPSERRSFAKFLAAKKADWRGETADKEQPKDTNAIQLGEGREVQRDGGGAWDRILVRPNGDGLGIVNDAIDVGYPIRLKISANQSDVLLRWHKAAYPYDHHTRSR